MGCISGSAHGGACQRPAPKSGGTSDQATRPHSAKPKALMTPCVMAMCGISMTRVFATRLYAYKQASTIADALEMAETPRRNCDGNEPTERITESSTTTERTIW